MNKRILSVMFSVIMVLTVLPASVFADGDALLTPEELREKKGAITVEAYNIGQGFLLEPSLYDKEGKSTGDITVEVLSGKNIGYMGSVSYFSGFEFDDTAEPVYPDYLIWYADSFSGEADGDGYLSEFDYSEWSGWCYTINDWWASWGADSSYPCGLIYDYNTGEKVSLGDVIRWHFTVYGYGADCGFPGNSMAVWMGGNLFTQNDKSDLIFILAAINDYYGNLDSDDVYETALYVAADPYAGEEEIDNQETILKSYIADTFLSVDKETKIKSFDNEMVYFTFPDEGMSATVIFADYENESLNTVKAIPVVTKNTDGKNIMSVRVPDGMNISVNDKIMLWDNLNASVPFCSAYVVGY